MNWKQSFLKGIQYRNMVEFNNFESIFKRYHTLHAEYMKTKDEFDQRKKEFRRRVNSGIEEQNADSELTQDYVRRISELQDQVHGLNEELRLSYRTNVSRGEELLKLKEDLKRVDGKNEKFEKDLQKERIDNNELKSKIDDLEKVVESKMSTVKILISEKKVLEEKFRKEKERCNRLNQEMDVIIQRTLDDKQKLIDRINENNDLQLQLSKKMDEIDKLRKKYRSQSRRSGKGGRVSGKDVRNADEVEDRLLLRPPEGVDERIRINTVGNSVMFSPSGQFFACGCDDKTVKVFNMSSRKLVHNFRCGQESVLRVRFSPNDELLLGTSTDNSIRVWNMREKRLKFTLTGHTKKVFAADFGTRDMKRIATGSHDKTIKLWDMYRGTMVKTILAQSSVNDLEVSSSNLIFSAHFNRSVKIFDCRTGKLITDMKNIHDLQITSVNVSKDERYLLTAGRDSLLKVFDFRNQKMLCVVNNDQYRNAINFSKAVFSPCGTYATAGSQNGKLIIWNVKKGSTHKVYPKAHNGAIQGVDWSEMGDKILTSAADKYLVLWN